MLVTNIKRIIKSSVINLWRSRIVSLSSILVMSVTLFVFGLLIFSNVALDSVLTQIKQKVDINVYLTTIAPEKDILSLKESLEGLPEVKSVEYVSREEALKKFKEKHSADQLTLQALDELEENPLGAVLNIQAKETSQYETIANFLNNEEGILSSEGQTVIDKVNYSQNKVVIDRLSKIISATEKIGFVATLVLVFISILITLNTIRLTIYIAKEEISVMRLVGASNAYVEGPFITAGIIYGLISSFLTILFFLPLTYYLDSFIQKLFGLNLFDYYLSNFWSISATLIFSGVSLGVVSSFFAVRKYLKV